jgi:hypothetical protein
MWISQEGKRACPSLVIFDIPGGGSDGPSHRTCSAHSRACSCADLTATSRAGSSVGAVSCRLGLHPGDLLGAPRVRGCIDRLQPLTLMSGSPERRARRHLGPWEGWYPLVGQAAGLDTIPAGPSATLPGPSGRRPPAGPLSHAGAHSAPTVRSGSHSRTPQDDGTSTRTTHMQSPQTRWHGSPERHTTRTPRAA